MNFVGYFLIAFGLLMIPKTTINWFIEFSNQARGVKTKITKTTIFLYRFIAILFLIIGLFLV